MPRRSIAVGRSRRSGSSHLRRAICEALEQRRLLDFGIAGDEGHGYIEVDIYHPTTGEQAGKLKAEFHAPRYCGDPAPKTGVIEVQGRLHYTYIPNARVGDNHLLSRKLQRNKSADRAVADFVHGVGGPNPDALAWDGQPVDAYVNASGAFATYNALTHNCFTFAAAAIDAAFNHRSWNWPESWENLLQYFDKAKATREKSRAGLDFERLRLSELPKDLLYRADLTEVPDAVS